jgi:hypothetical protein
MSLLASCSTTSSIKPSERFEEKKSAEYTRILIVNSVPEKEVTLFANNYNADYIEYMPYHGPAGLAISKLLYRAFDVANPAILRMRGNFISLAKKHKKVIFIVPNDAKYLFRSILKGMDHASLSAASGYVWVVGESGRNEGIETIVRNVSAGRIEVKYGK